jgi:hypothetical protein
LMSASAATALYATTASAASEVVATSANTGAGYVDDQAPAPTAAPSPPPPPSPPAVKPDNPYDHLGDNPFIRFWKYQALELGLDSAPVDPTVTPLSTVRPGWPTVPETTPPMPFLDWPYGGTTSLGDNRTASIDSPLMVATIQAYGWIDVGGNVSSSKLPSGNAPAAYDYKPNTIQLDQAVLYVERTPDTVQADHIDWGFRVSAIYGENYRYTTSYGLGSYQLLDENKFNGYDFPMVYGEIYFPQVMQGPCLTSRRSSRPITICIHTLSPIRWITIPTKVSRRLYRLPSSLCFKSALVSAPRPQCGIWDKRSPTCLF